jgi:phosphatidate cytidylyltransferase
MARTTSRRRSQGNKDSSPRVKTTTPSPEKDNVGNKTASATQTKKKSKKMSTTRIIVSWMMTIYALLMFFFMQHVGNNITVFLIQVICYKELVFLGYDKVKEKELKTFKYFYIYWGFLATLWGWGSIFKDQWHRSGFDNITGIDESLPPFEFLIYCLYIVGLIFLVLSLQKRENYRYQLQQFCYSHCALLFVIAQSCCLIQAQYRGGLFYALISLNLVVCNDCFAYICGKKFGKTPLIGLSPNKTKEGFFGAMMVTFIDGILFSRFLTDPNYDPLYRVGLISEPFLQPIMTCKPHGVVGTSFSFNIPKCDLLDIYKPQQICSNTYPKVSYILSFIPGGVEQMVCDHFSWSQIQSHSIVLAAFASLIAPFYGFLGSAVKRAVGVKDFGDLFPGHGGMTDRFDCNFGMATFTYMYLVCVLGSQVIEG